MSGPGDACNTWRECIGRIQNADARFDSMIEAITKELPADESLVSMTTRQLNIIMRQNSLMNGYLYTIALMLAEKADKEIA